MKIDTMTVRQKRVLLKAVQDAQDLAQAELRRLQQYRAYDNTPDHRIAPMELDVSALADVVAAIFNAETTEFDADR